VRVQITVTRCEVPIETYRAIARGCAGGDASTRASGADRSSSRRTRSLEDVPKNCPQGKSCVAATRTIEAPSDTIPAKELWAVLARTSDPACRFGAGVRSRPHRFGKRLRYADAPTLRERGLNASARNLLPLLPRRHYTSGSRARSAALRRPSSPREKSRRTRRSSNPGRPESNFVRSPRPRKTELPFCCHELKTGACSHLVGFNEKAPFPGLFRGGRYWARTSDPQLVELVLSQLS
jgi:hypothetical protein